MFRSHKNTAPVEQPANPPRRSGTLFSRNRAASPSPVRNERGGLFSSNRRSSSSSDERRTSASSRNGTSMFSRNNNDDPVILARSKVAEVSFSVVARWDFG